MEIADFQFVFFQDMSDPKEEASSPFPNKMWQKNKFLTFSYTSLFPYKTYPSNDTNYQDAKKELK
jgi:hypothetical protein